MPHYFTVIREHLRRGDHSTALELLLAELENVTMLNDQIASIADSANKISASVAKLETLAGADNPALAPVVTQLQGLATSLDTLVVSLTPAAPPATDAPAATAV